jgi:hypothetical protein
MAMELREALAQIEEIRLQMARTETFRGFKALPVAFSGVLAFAAAAVQAVWLPDPVQDLPAYLLLWMLTALLSAAAAGTEMLLRAARADSPLARETNWLAVEQFLPCLVAGSLTTAVVLRFLPDHVFLLPGLWSIFFSLGVFACWRLLPRAIFGVGMFYLAAGAATLALAQGPHALSPWSMGLTFGVGQFLAAAVLYWTLER